MTVVEPNSGRQRKRDRIDPRLSAVLRPVGDRDAPAIVDAVEIPL